MPGVGDPCPLMYGWLILALREQCPNHGCERYDLRTKQGVRQNNVCPQCWRAKKREYAKRYREQNKVDNCVHYVSTQPWEGEEEVFLRLWSYKADKKIDEFWAARGMTEDDAKAKFAPRFRIPLGAKR